MKRQILWLLCLWCVVPLCAQSLPAEWLKYSNREQYLHEVRTDHNSKGGSESLFCENLRQSAIVGLARQIEVQVNGVSTTNKEAHNGHTHTAYQSTSTLSTNVDLQLVQSDVHYDRTTGEGVAIAWIDKQAACGHYLNEVRQLFSKVEGRVKMAEEYAATGYDKRAVAEFEQAQSLLKEADKYLSRLSLFGLDGALVGRLSGRGAALRLTVEQGLKESRHGQTIHLVCSADLFGSPQVGFGAKIKGGLSAEGCNFVASADGAEWSVEIVAGARQQQVRNMGGMSLYTSYADAVITITNCKTGQVVCADEVTAKGSHTVGYTEAARTAYDELKSKILQTIKTYIN